LRRCRWQKAKADQTQKLFERSEFFCVPLLLHWQQEFSGAAVAFFGLPFLARQER